MKIQAPETRAAEHDSSSSSAGAKKPNIIIRWHRRVLGFCLVIFALELGLFLLIYPWRREWALSWVPVHSPQFFGIWMSRFFRGLVSGLGLLNLYISMAELSKQVKAILKGEQR